MSSDITIFIINCDIIFVSIIFKKVKHVEISKRAHYITVYMKIVMPNGSLERYAFSSSVTGENIKGLVKRIILFDCYTLLASGNRIIANSR
jgi:hypothetical protein